MRKIFFIAWLFCMGAGALLGGGMALYENVNFWYGGRAATMELADKSKRVIVPSGGYDVHFVDVKYVNATGEVIVPKKRLSGDVARRLANGEKVQVTYLVGNPQQAMYEVRNATKPMVVADHRICKHGRVRLRTQVAPS